MEYQECSSCTVCEGGSTRVNCTNLIFESNAGECGVPPMYQILLVNTTTTTTATADAPPPTTTVPTPVPSLLAPKPPETTEEPTTIEPASGVCAIGDFWWFYHVMVVLLLSLSLPVSLEG